MKRLFLFAAYDERGMVGPALVHYVSCLDRLGDVVLYADSSMQEGQLDKLERFVLHAEASRHEEYDFGSYKRCWEWASAELDLTLYDFVYIVNDSVFGPFGDLGACLDRLESMGKDAFSMVYFPHKTYPHMQTWFVGFTTKVFMSAWFTEFMSAVEKLPGKDDVCVRYEVGLSRLIESKGLSCGALYHAPHKSIYNKARRFCNLGLPFVKKSTFTRHNGSLGYQVRRVLEKSDSEVRNAVLDEASMLWGEGYVESMMSQSRTDSIKAYLEYLFAKITAR